MGRPSASALDSGSAFRFSGVTVRIFSAWAVVAWAVVGLVLNMMWSFFANGWVTGLSVFLVHMVWGLGLAFLLIVESFEGQRGSRPLLLAMILLLVAFPLAMQPLKLSGDWIAFWVKRPAYDRIIQAGQHGELARDARPWVTGKSDGVDYAIVFGPPFLATFDIYRGVPDSGAAIVFDPEGALAKPEVPSGPESLGIIKESCIHVDGFYYRCSYN